MSQVQTPKNNSIRLQRLSRTTDLYSNRSTSLLDNTTELVKLPALRAINKSVKYNDLSFATSRDLNKLRKEPDQPDNIEEMSAHSSLVVIRKKYDNINKNRMQKQRAVNVLQKEHDKLTIEKDTFQSQKKEGSAKVSNLVSSLNSMKLLLEETDTDKKVMQNMINRLKNDKVVYDLRKFNMEKNLSQIGKFKGSIVKEHEKQKEEDDRTEKMKIKLINHLEAQKKERDTHIQSVSGMLAEKEDINQLNEIRKQEMTEVALYTLQDKSGIEKNWEKVYLCHRFVQRVLRDKMHREMVKFNVVEVAFKNIKTATGVNNAETLVKKFLSKESTYGDLLGKIADDQRIIAGLKSENDELRKERRVLKDERQQLNSNKIESVDLSEDEKTLKNISNKSSRCYTYLQKMDSWLTRNLKKFDITQSVDEKRDFNSPFEINNRFKAYLQALSSNLQNLKEFEDKVTDITGVISENNCRINLNQEPLENRHQTHNTESVPHPHPHGHGHREHHQHHHHYHNDEEAFIENQREEVLRANDKFMKELKKKYEDIKKAMIESLPKKKEPIVEKPKAPPAQE